MSSILLAISTCAVHARVVVYHLSVARLQVNMTGKDLEVMTINGGIPGPVPRFTEGDQVSTRVRNTMVTILKSGLAPSL
jgi:FtsP/CotA-like multicopper oxidase with cupredoxin domain